MLKGLAAIATAALVASGLALGQVKAAQAMRVLLFEASYGSTVNSDWPFQATLVSWYAISATVVGALAGGLVARTADGTGVCRSDWPRPAARRHAYPSC